MIKYSAVATAIALATGATSLHAALPLASATFTMRSPGGTVVGSFSDVTGTYDSTAATWLVASPSPFFGVNWTAHDGILFGPGTYNIATIPPNGAYTGPGFTGIVVGAGQVGGHILFDYGPTKNIDVINVWDEVCVPQPTFLECTYTSVDGPAGNPPNPDGKPGYGMLDGAFPGWSAAFDFVVRPPLPGAPTFTPPADVDLLNTTVTATPATVQVPLGTVTDEAPGSATVEYSIDGLPVTDPMKVWIADDDANNLINFTLTETVNTLVVDWRASNAGSVTTATQNVRITIDDQAAPVIDSTNAQDLSTSVISTADSVCFGAISANDAIEPNLTIEWSHDGFNWNPANPDTGNLTDNCSTGFGPNANTMYWRAIDVAGNTATYQQTVTLILPAGITGKACTIDLAYAGSRLLDGRFTMRDPTGAISGNIDDTITGDIDTTVFCNDPDPAVCNPVPPAASLVTKQAFFGSLWTATPVRLYGPDTSGPVPLAKTWTFEACPFPRTYNAADDDWVAADGSIKCNDATTPNLLSMTVGPGQIGAHMLFDWSVNPAIDVVVVWDVDCNKFELTTTDPDGDGILATKMVDGPFKGFNAAFDVSTQAGEPPIADGGYTTTVPTVENPVTGESPIPLNTTSPTPAVVDPAAVRSCVGGCYEFTAPLTHLLDGNDAGGAYKYVQAVLPLSEATPFWSLYRKFDNATQTWGPFTIDNRNDVKTAPLDIATGECPQPGNGSYDRPISGALPGKLRGGDMCVQLTIEDGGPNDGDGVGNDSVQDPGGVAEVPAAALPAPATSGGGCTVAVSPVSPAKGGGWWLLAGFIGWMGWKRYRS